MFGQDQDPFGHAVSLQLSIADRLIGRMTESGLPLYVIPAKRSASRNPVPPGVPSQDSHSGNAREREVISLEQERQFSNGLMDKSSITTPWLPFEASPPTASLLLPALPQSARSFSSSRGRKAFGGPLLNLQVQPLQAAVADPEEKAS